MVSYDSLADIWSQWYADYLDSDDFPRLMVRYGDILMYPTEILTRVCQCAGGIDPFHGENPTGLVEAITRYHDKR